MHQQFLFFAISISLVACAPTINHVEITSSSLTSATTQTTCQPSQIQKSKNSFPEIQGTMKSEGEMWALLFFESAHTNDDEKIVWRITGAGEEFRAQAQNEDGTIILPVWVRSIMEAPIGSAPAQNGELASAFPNRAVGKLQSLEV